MANIILGVNVDQVDTSPKFNLGTLAGDVKGGEGQLAGLGYDLTNVRTYSADSEWIYVQAGSLIAVGDWVKIDFANASEPNVVIPVTATANEAVFGCSPRRSIPALSYGWIQIKGRVASQLADPGVGLRFGPKVITGVTAGAFLGTGAGAAGQLIVATSQIGGYTGRGAQALDASADDGGGQFRAECYIY